MRAVGARRGLQASLGRRRERLPSSGPPSLGCSPGCSPGCTFGRLGCHFGRAWATHRARLHTWAARPLGVAAGLHGAHRSKAAGMGGPSRSRTALNEPSVALPAVNRSPRVLEAPPDPVSTHTRASWPSVRTPEGRNANRTSGDAPGGSAAPRGTECCRSVTEGARSTPRPSFDPPCSRSAIRSDRARSESDDASWRRSTGSAESASESRVE